MGEKMSDHKINPEKVTKPIQLLAAWLVGLIAIDMTFLLAAQQISKPEWASSALVVAAIVNVPIFITALFLLQTKFRPQMQEDSYYAKYLEGSYTSTNVSSEVAVKAEVAETTKKLVERLGSDVAGKEASIAQVLNESLEESLVSKHGRSRSLSELYKVPETWKYVTARFDGEASFLRDVEGLLSDGLIERHDTDFSDAKLTSLGKKVASLAEKRNQLFYQVKPEIWTDMRDSLRDGHTRTKR